MNTRPTCDAAPDEMFDLFEEIEMDPLPGEGASEAFEASGGGGWLDQYDLDSEVMAILGEVDEDAADDVFTDMERGGHDDHDNEEA